MNRPSRILTIAVCLVVLVAQILVASAGLRKFLKSSEEFLYLGSVRDYDPKTTLLISEVPKHQAYSLILEGPLYYLSDLWGPKLFRNDLPSGSFSVVDLDFQNRNRTIVGTLKLPLKIEGPIFFDDLCQLPGFIPTYEPCGKEFLKNDASFRNRSND